MKRVLLVLTVAVLATASTGAQWLRIPTPGIPRTPDGKPNLAAPAPRTPEGRPVLGGLWKTVPARLIVDVTAGLSRGFERAVVGGPESRLAVGLVEAEGERALDAVTREEREQVLEGRDESVDVAADVHVRVEEPGALRAQVRNFVVVHGDELPCPFQSVLHRLRNLPQLGFDNRA